MTDNKRQLEVGNVIYEFQHGDIICKMTVTRVTKTFAFCQNPWNNNVNLKFKRNCSKYIKMVGQLTWSRISYELATPELDKKFVVAKMRNRIKQVTWEHISEDILKKVYNLLGYGVKKSEE